VEMEDFSKYSRGMITNGVTAADWLTSSTIFLLTIQNQ